MLDARAPNLGNRVQGTAWQGVQGESALARKHVVESGLPSGLLRQLNLHSPFATARGRVLLVAWAVLTAGVLVALLATDLGRARSQLEQLGDVYLQHVSDRALVSETAIEGFAAFVAALQPLNHERAHEYARTLLVRYPFLYMFEVAARVSDTDRMAFEQRLAARYPGFRIRRFDYDTDRSWQVAGNSDFYYPLVFQEPLLSGPANLLGLDIHSGEFLRKSMQASFSRGQPVATHPFELAEGRRGYVLHRSVEDLGSRPPSAFEADQYVLLALRSEELFGALPSAPSGVEVRLAHGDFAIDDPRGAVLFVAARPASVTESLLLPRFSVLRQLQLTSQPFLLSLDWQLAWSDLSLGPMAAVIFCSILLFLWVRSYARQYITSELDELENEGRLYELANFDPLTGLANRNRLMDVLESALARARRQKLQLAVLFIDLDGFKEVNDSHGHATGDLVLVEAARRLARHLREEELLARYGGDEFVWVTAGSSSPPLLDGLMARLRREFARPFVIGKVHVQLGMSVGHAVYPSDGKNIAALFETADAGMYRDKRGSGAGSPAGVGVEVSAPNEPPATQEDG